MHKIFAALTLGAGFAVANSASAQVTSFTLEAPGDGSGQDLTVDFDGQFTGAQVLIELTSGTLTSAANFFPVPGDESADITFIANGVVPVGFSTAPGLAGAAVDLTTEGGRVLQSGQGTTPVATTTLFDVAAFTPPSQQGPGNVDATDFVVARFGGFSADANGLFAVLASANQDPVIIEGAIVNGVAVIPEPATAALMGLAGLGMLARRRQTT